MRTNSEAFWQLPARSTLAIALALTCASITTGCSRTDDGSMLLSRPSMSLGFGRLTERIAERRRARAQQAVAVTAFPEPPPPVVEPAPPPPQVARPASVRRAAPPARAARRTPVRASDVRAPRVAVKPPFQASEPSKQLTCTDMATAAKTGGRVKVSCQ